MEPTLQTIRELEVNKLPEPNDAESTISMLVGLRSHFAARDLRVAPCAHSCVTVSSFPIRGLSIDPATGVLRMPVVARK